MMLVSLILILAGAGVASAKPGETKAKRVVVGQSISLARKLKKPRERIWEEVEAAARDGSWTLIKAENNAGQCSVKECPQEYAEREAASSVLSIEGLYTNAGFSVNIRIWSKNGKNGQSGWVGEFSGECELCSSLEFSEAVGINVRKALVAEAERMLATPVNSIVDRPMGPNPPRMVSLAPPPPAAPKPLQPAHERILAPWIVVGAGAVVTGLGIGLWATDGDRGGDCWGKTCGRVYDTRGIGIVTTSVGIATMLSGGGWYLYKWRSHASVAVGPGTLHLAGKF